jgi:PhnB protein
VRRRKRLERGFRLLGALDRKPVDRRNDVTGAQVDRGSEEWAVKRHDTKPAKSAIYRHGMIVELDELQKGPQPFDQHSFQGRPRDAGGGGHRRGLDDIHALVGRRRGGRRGGTTPASPPDKNDCSRKGDAHEGETLACASPQTQVFGARVKPVPARPQSLADPSCYSTGAMRLSFHLVFAGQCESAFRFYETTLGGKIDMMLTYGASPMAAQVSPERRDEIVHASLTIGDLVLAGADVTPEEYEKPQGFYILLTIDDRAEAKRIFHALAQNGAVRMPIQKTFWSPAFGVLVDRFGTPWEISVTDS